jgi:hypothetical protein
LQCSATDQPCARSLPLETAMTTAASGTVHTLGPPAKNGLPVSCEGGSGVATLMATRTRATAAAVAGLGAAIARAKVLVLVQCTGHCTTREVARAASSHKAHCWNVRVDLTVASDTNSSGCQKPSTSTTSTAMFTERSNAGACHRTAIFFLAILKQRRVKVLWEVQCSTFEYFDSHARGDGVARWK